MKYLVARVIANDTGYLRPVAGRLGKRAETKWVAGTGFGHEDWNFARHLAIDGHVYGYLYYHPQERFCGEHFNVAFMIYRRTNKTWHLVGFYRNCVWAPDGAPRDNRVLRGKVRDLRDLGNSLGTRHKDGPRGRSSAELLEYMNDARQWERWKVAVSDIVRLEYPVPVPRLLAPRKKRVSGPTFIEAAQWNDLLRLGKCGSMRDSELKTPAALEGTPLEKRHMSRERNNALAGLAKDAFLAKHGRYFCEACTFDFQQKYGELGRDFIEVHHRHPLQHGARRTAIVDLALVCSNCHRMLHRRLRQGLRVEDIKILLKCARGTSLAPRTTRSSHA